MPDGDGVLRGDGGMADEEMGDCGITTKVVDWEGGEREPFDKLFAAVVENTKAVTEVWVSDPWRWLRVLFTEGVVKLWETKLFRRNVLQRLLCHGGGECEWRGAVFGGVERQMKGRWV